MNQVGFGYGPLCDSLETQANVQGYTLGDDAEKFEKIKDAINMVMFYVATDSQVNAMTKKLQEQVVKALKPMKKEID